ncbi:hypothetical protein [Desulfolithobacter sp.]
MDNSKIMNDLLFVFIRYGHFNRLPVLYGLVNVLKKKFMILFLDSEDVMTVISLQIPDMRGIGAEGILVDNNLQMRMIFTEFLQKPSDGVALTIHFFLAVLLSDYFRAERNNNF